MAETQEQLIEFAKKELAFMRWKNKRRQEEGRSNTVLLRNIAIYEAFLESHGVEVEKDE